MSDINKLLRDCKEKLALYYRDTQGNYNGGPPYRDLIKQIDIELGKEAPFGRQPQMVVVTITGHEIDVDRWTGELRRRAENAGDVTNLIHQRQGTAIFHIHPRAVND